MKLWITGPSGDLGGLRTGLEKRWKLAAKDAGADVEFIPPTEHEIHGEMLTRLWVQEIRDSSDPEHILSEIDFLPVRGTLAFLSQAPTHLVGVHYVRREVPPGADPLKVPGELKTYEQEGIPLIAPWFLYLRLRPGQPLPPENWLDAQGQFNDAANLALVHALQSGFLLGEDDFGLIPGQDAWPVVHGVRYPSLGTHTFFAASFDAPADKELCWGLKAGDHLSNVRAMLR